jgi:hypothetical protein
VKDLVKSAVDFAIKDMDKPTSVTGSSISKNKKNNQIKFRPWR